MAAKEKTKKPISQLREEIHVEINTNKVVLDPSVHHKTEDEKESLKLAKKLWKSKNA